MTSEGIVDGESVSYGDAATRRPGPRSGIATRISTYDPSDVADGGAHGEHARYG